MDGRHYAEELAAKRFDPKLTPEERDRARVDLDHENALAEEHDRHERTLREIEARHERQLRGLALIYN